MRLFVTVLTVAVALTSSAFAGDIGPWGTAQCGSNGAAPSAPAACSLAGSGGYTYGPGNTINGNGNVDQWVALNGSLVDPYVLVNLGASYTLDNITIDGVGNSGATISFEVFATNAFTTVGALESTTPLLTVTGQAGGSAWNHGQSFATTPYQYILYEVTGGTDWGYATEILADDPGVPEPGTFGLLGAGLLALGFAWRSRK